MTNLQLILESVAKENTHIAAAGRVKNDLDCGCCSLAASSNAQDAIRATAFDAKVGQRDQGRCACDLNLSNYRGASSQWARECQAPVDHQEFQIVPVVELNIRTIRIIHRSLDAVVCAGNHTVAAKRDQRNDSQGKCQKYQCVTTKFRRSLSLCRPLH